MNAQERAVIDGIFERLRQVANQPRDAEAERYITDLIRQQPYAPYAMAQSVYVQEQALLNQQQEIQALQAQITQLQQSQAAPQPQSGGFLSGLFGGGQPRPASATPAFGQRPPAGQGMPMQAAPQPGPWGGQPQQPAGPWGGQPQAAPQRQGMGFLGTAAAAAAGVAGGMVLGNVLSNALGGGHQAHAAEAGSGLFGGSTPALQQEAAPLPPDPGFADPGYDTAADDGFDDFDAGGGGDSYDV